jgi:hypothetical protein
MFGNQARRGHIFLRLSTRVKKVILRTLTVNFSFFSPKIWKYWFQLYIQCVELKTDKKYGNPKWLKWAQSICNILGGPLLKKRETPGKPLLFGVARDTPIDYSLNGTWIEALSLSLHIYSIHIYMYKGPWADRVVGGKKNSALYTRHPLGAARPLVYSLSTPLLRGGN